MPLLHSEIATTHSGPQPTAGYLLKVTNTSTQALTVGAAWLVADDAPRSSPPAGHLAARPGCPALRTRPYRERQHATLRYHQRVKFGASPHYWRRNRHLECNRRRPARQMGRARADPGPGYGKAAGRERVRQRLSAA
ncbi:hypothetical protein ACFSC4_20125 [Deinococcus malanensis]|uniref:hypothetical protein n=1 Tax=Deinococcus malanensis TaxID=1706855 RepID=UPI00363EDB41